MAKVAVAFAEDEVREELASLLKRLGHEVAPASSLQEGLSVVQAGKPQVLVVEEGLDGTSGEVLVREAQRVAPLLPVIVCLKRRDAPRAVEFLKLGAFECVAPPWTSEALGVPIRRALRVAGTTFDLVRPDAPSRELVRRIFLSILGAAALALLVTIGLKDLRERRARSEAPLSAPLPYAHPAGLAWHDGKLWAGDWFGASVYVHDPKTLAIVRVKTLPGEPPVCLAFVEGSLWIVTDHGRVKRHLLDEKLTVLGSARLPGSPVGLAYDGLYLWSLDKTSGRLRKHLLDDELSELAEVPFPGRKPAALAWDGRSLWSLDEGGRLYRHDPAHPEQVLETFDLPEYAGGWKAGGLAWDGVRFWTVAESPDGKEGRIFRHRLP